jgi:tRNA-splicing endonuclease subunit Sen2
MSKRQLDSHVKTRCLRDVWPPVAVTSMTSVHHQSQSRGDSSQKKGNRKRNENNLIYANPLPIAFSPIENRFIVTALGIFGISPARVLNPRCKGIFDPITRSVWITDLNDRMILWRRGFFGKGNLSRSEPSWLVRQSNIRSPAARRKLAFMYTH